MEEAGNFLAYVYRDSVVDVANIKVAVGEGDKETVLSYLRSVRAYTHNLITAIENG